LYLRANFAPSKLPLTIKVTWETDRAVIVKAG
jgi:hypothetical protein